MSAILLDTSIASLFHPKRAPNSVLLLYEHNLLNHTPTISFQTAAELFLWADQNQWGPRARAELEMVMAKFAILEVDTQLMRTWAKVMRDCRLAGRRLDTDDAWVVATAIRHNLPLLTHDRDMTDLPIDKLNIITHLK